MKLSAETPSGNKSMLASTLTPEWSLLLAVCSVTPDAEKFTCLRNLLQQPLDWHSLFALAENHGVQPLLYQALAKMEEHVPADQWRCLQRMYQANLHKALLLAGELIRILDRLSALGIEAMPYKGLVVAEALYGDIGLRQSGDIDLLIHTGDFLHVRTAALELGYTEHTPSLATHVREYLRSGYECSFDGAAGPNLLEVQWAIQPGFYAIDFDMPGLFQRAMSITVAGAPMKTLSLEDLLLVLSAHAAKHVWQRLIWLCDLARISTLPNLDWNWIASRARGLGIARILNVSLLLSEQMLGTAIPRVAIEAGFAANDAAAPEIAGDVQAHILSASGYNLESLAYFRLMMRLRERIADRLRFLHRLAFTPGPGEWNAIRLPRPLFPWYRLVRLSRLAARFVR